LSASYYELPTDAKYSEVPLQIAGERSSSQSGPIVSDAPDFLTPRTVRDLSSKPQHRQAISNNLAGNFLCVGEIYAAAKGEAFWAQRNKLGKLASSRSEIGGTCFSRMTPIYGEIARNVPDTSRLNVRDF